MVYEPWPYAEHLAHPLPSIPPATTVSQRARRGESTLYSDHKVVIRDAKRQLSIILAIPIVGFIALVLGLPPRMNSEGSNLPTLFGFTSVVIFGVWVLIWRANQQYRSLYGKLTELEVKTGMLQRDLGDPAKLLTELTGPCSSRQCDDELIV